MKGHVEKGTRDVDSNVYIIALAIRYVLGRRLGSAEVHTRTVLGHIWRRI
jgi:hypothetical protein